MKNNEKKDKKTSSALYDFVKVTAAVPSIIWYRMKRIYETPLAKKKVKGGALVVSNHVGYCDPLYLNMAFWYRRVNFVALKEFFQGKAKFWFEHFLCIPIDRDTTDIACFREVKERLDKGKLVVIFPEGQVEDDAKMQTFKSGMVLMAMRSNCPIVPVYLVQRKHWYNRLRLVIGEPINVKEMLGKMPSLADIDKVSQYIFTREQHLKEIYETNTNKRRKK